MRVHLHERTDPHTTSPAVPVWLQLGSNQIASGESLVQSPISHPHKIIHVGRDVGRITCQLGRIYPTAKVYGAASPLALERLKQQESLIGPAPDNVEYCEFKELADRANLLTSSSYTGDYESLWLRPADLILHRCFLGAFSQNEITIPQMTRLLKPSGWFEVQCYSPIWYRNGQVISDSWQWLQAMRSGAEAQGIDLDMARSAKSALEQEGLVDLQVKE